MRRQIKYEADYQQFAIMFNTSMDIIQTAAYINKLISCDLSYTGELESFDEHLKLPFNFKAFSDEDPASKLTYILIQNKTCSKHSQTTGSLFESEEFIIQKNILGDKKTNSIYHHKNFSNPDFCFIISFPHCQIKPTFISKLKDNDKIQTSIEINMNEFTVFDDLMGEIEQYIDKYNSKNPQMDLSNYRKQVIKKQKEAKAENANRIIFSTLNHSNDKR